MDIYPGRQLAPGVGQTHDFNPGVASNGLFWTVAIPSGAGVVLVRRDEHRPDREREVVALRSRQVGGGPGVCRREASDDAVGADDRGERRSRA